MLDSKGNPIGNGNEMNINITPDDVEPLICQKCTNPLFFQAVVLGKISGIKLGQAEDQIVALDQKLICARCGLPYGTQLEENEQKKEGVEIKEEEIKEEEKDSNNIIKFGE
jgi:hypothetical protein